MNMDGFRNYVARLQCMDAMPAEELRALQAERGSWIEFVNGFYLPGLRLEEKTEFGTLVNKLFAAPSAEYVIAMRRGRK